MSELLPLFPLSTVLFPGMPLPLHIFEPRYRALVRRCLERSEAFGVALIRSGEEVGAPAEPHAIGTSARIVHHAPLPDGRSFIVVRGERRFAIEEVLRDLEPYLVARVRWLREELGEDALRFAADAAEAYAEYRLAVETLGGTAPALAEQREPPSPRETAYEIAAGLAVDAPERQRLLEHDSLSALLASELRLIERERTLLQELLVRQRAKGERGPLH